MIISIAKTLLTYFNWSKTISSFFLCSLFWVPLIAQNMISGTILSEKDEIPLIGANIEIEGTDQGVSSDLSGHFTFEVPDLETILVVSYTGYESQVVALAGRTSLTLLLSWTLLLLKVADSCCSSKWNRNKSVIHS